MYSLVQRDLGARSLFCSNCNYAANLDIKHFPADPLVFAPQQLQNVDNAYDLRIVNPTSLLRRDCKDGRHSFKGGIRKMLVTRRLALEGGSETSSDACDTDVSGPDGGDDPVDDLDVEFIRVKKKADIKEGRKRLRLLKAENDAAAGGVTLACCGGAPCTRCVWGCTCCRCYH